MSFQPCLICNESRYTEKCHIIPRSFDGDMIAFKLYEQNFLILCPTHHKLFDKDLLIESEKLVIMPKVLYVFSAFKEASIEKYQELLGRFNLKYDRRLWLKEILV